MRKEDMVAMYKRFKKWCEDNPYLDLDPRLHSHSGPIGEGGYISHEKTAVAFAAWRAALQAEVERLRENGAMVECIAAQHQEPTA
jgi:hypothetical protein